MPTGRVLWKGDGGVDDVRGDEGSFARAGIPQPAA